MYRKVTNPIAIQSQKAFCETMMTLLKTLPFEDITITHLCEEAHLVRKTFYRNFETKEDVLICLLDYQFQEYMKQISPDTHSVYDFSNQFFAFWVSHAQFLKTLQENALFYLVNRIFLHYLEEINELVHLEFQSSVDQLYSLHFLAGGLCDMLAYWISKDCPIPYVPLLAITSGL